MSAGFKYDLTPEPSIEERYDVSTGIVRRGPFKLDTTNLNIGAPLPSFIPVAADLKYKTCKVVRNVKLVEAYVSGGTSLRIKKGSYAYVGMFLGNGTNGTTVSAIDKSNSSYDVLTVTDFGANIAKDAVLFEASAAGGTTPKNVANSALYESRKVEDGINLVALLSAAREIEPDKLVVPFSAKDKESLGDDFQFNE
ncbi:head fiber protein [Bacteroides reticulotermitis]|uniref:head fiber protein n=1 Tax=Bacteroides reticulotermitis TaxID=1133319 RepID=UPI003A84CAD6